MSKDKPCSKVLQEAIDWRGTFGWHAWREGTAEVSVANEIAKKEDWRTKHIEVETEKTVEVEESWQRKWISIRNTGVIRNSTGEPKDEI